MNIFLLSIAWTGIVMLVDYSMWDGNIMSWYYDWLNSSKYRIVEALGLCKICFCLWFGIPFYYIMIEHFDKNYFIFLGISQMTIIFYHFLKTLTLK